MPSKNARTLISIAAAAEHLGVSQKSIRNYIATGQLPGYRVGPSLLRLDYAEVDAYAIPVRTAGDAA